jgi:serine/threonine-protein kinase RsbW
LEFTGETIGYKIKILRFEHKAWRLIVEFVVRDRSDVNLIALIGRLDATGVAEIEEKFGAAVTGRALHTILDLSGITFLSSIGIGFLFSNAKALKKAGCKLVLLNPEGMVEATFRTSKMDKVMPIHFSLKDALGQLGIEVTEGDRLPARSASEGDGTLPARSASEGLEDAGIKLSLKNSLSELKELYAKVGDFLAAHNIPHRPAYALNLALEELVVNVIRYAYMDLDEHTINIDLRIMEGRLVLLIEDDGRPFDPREAESQDMENVQDLDDVEVGGLGIAIVLDTVDSLRYKRSHDKNRTEVQVRIHQPVVDETLEEEYIA